MNLLLYILGSILLGAALAAALPRLAVILGALLLLVFLATMGACIYREQFLPPHDTSDIGMLATIEFLTILPLSLTLIAVGAWRSRG